MTGQKPVLQSLTIQSLIIGLLFYSTQLMGWDLDQGYITEFVQTTITLISLFIAGYGRVRATKVLK